MREVSALPASTPVTEIAAIIAEVLDLDTADVDPGTSLTSLGLESFTAVRLRRRLREDLDLDLPLTAFLGGATAATVAAGVADPDGEASFPLTPLQTAYWIGRDPAFPLGGVATFYYREYDRHPKADDPEADVERLAAAWNRLVARHPMLRMVVDRDGRQRILPEVDEYRIARTDLRAAAPQDAENALDELRRARSHQTRPTDRWPLFDIHAILLPDGRTRIQLGVDVLALDLAGWMQVLAEWGTLFEDPDAELPQARATFAEVLRRRNEDPAERQRRELDLEYWRARAATLPDGPRLPWSTDLAEIHGHRFTRHTERLSPEVWQELRARAAAEGLSPTGLLLAAFGLTLARWGAAEPFTLNTTLFDRPDEPDLRHLVGDFTSTLLVQMPPGRPESGFLAFAKQVNQRFWTDLEHRSVSGVEVLREAGAGGGTDLTPTHPVVFTSGIGLSEPGESPAGWLGEEVFGISQTPQVALDHIVHEEGGALRICWDTVEDSLPPGFAPGMAAAHALLLRRLADSPRAWTDPALAWDPSFLPPEPLDRCPFEDAGPLLNDPLRAAADRAPGLPALVDSAHAVTHGELAERVARTGALLNGAGVGARDLVAVCLDKGVDQVAALLGVMASGAGYVPVEPSWPAERIASVCAQAGVRRALVAAGSTVVWPAGVAVHETAPTGELSPVPEVAEASGGDGPRRPAADDLAYVIFTSGSTGRPKGVAIEHRAARTTIDDLIDRFPVGPDDRMLALSAFSFDLSVHDVFGVMGTGAALVLPDAERQRDPGHWLELMARHRVTLWNTAPALMEMLVEYAEIDPDLARTALADLRLVFLSADWIPVTLPDRLRALAPHAQVVSLGGATEGSIWSICYPVEEVDPGWPSIPYGRALRGQSFHIIDAATGAPSPVGVPGELFIGGDGLARGYIGDPAQTAERFIDHPVLGRLYHTGDMGRWRADGNIEFLGRLDRQVKIRGHRIELGEVESALDRVPGVRHAVAMSMRGPDDRPRLVAFLIESETSPAPEDERLIGLLRERVPDYMVPSRIVRMARFPVTDNGKIDYKALENPYARPRNGARTTGDEAPLERGRTPAPPEHASGADRVPAAEHAPAPERTGIGSPPDTGLDGLVRQALASGLAVSLRVGAGDLTPARALTASGAWTAAVEETALPGVATAHRLCADGLVEIDLLPAGAASDGTAHNGTGPAAAAGAPASGLTAAPAPPAPVADAAQASSSVAGTAPGHPAGTRPAPRGEHRDPEAERIVTRVLGELLQTDIDPTTPFFRLGATSLTLVLAHRRLVEELDPALSVVDLFTHPTARGLAEHVAAGRAPSEPADTAGLTGPLAAGAPAAEAGPPAPTPGGPPASFVPAAPSSRAEARLRARAAATEVAR
ncbi:amino acid adenylation domain-containing protein [Nocardiopsis sp. Huas11]|uniref:non-ribosomal peptide synthetase n=1 Tax=Nocardiopsis sp. Huas11 TaxID=2183912 RepID=UPI000EAFD4B8|nr:non-ribosomal peptide synthetase [Nocardiopsis sp. Huas11]RKS09343.1 amino acid adenylation domain-containing protein [Nocardiopsis sp. Huas11]